MTPAEVNRPYWHIDVKWVCGLLAIPILSLWLLGLGLYRLTDRGHAPTTVYALAQSVFSNPNNDVNIDAGKLRQQLEPLYLSGPRGVARVVSNDPTEQSKLTKQLGVFQLFTKDTHDKLGWALIIWTIITLIPLAGVFYFSHRAGRFVSLGITLIISSILGTLIFLTFQTGSNESGMRLASIGPAVLRLVGAAFLPAYLATLILGVIFLLTASVLKLRHHSQP